MENVEKIKTTGLFTNYIYKAIPLAFDESMSYYECLCGLLSYLKDTIIPAVNNNADNIIDLQNKYNELKSYVDNYFDNLDIQTEINNKLDEMAEDGTLQEIVASYLETQAIFGFDNVNDLKASTNLINGSYAETLGYYQKNDNGGALYYITNENLTPDDASIIELDSGLYAVLINKDNTITPEQFACYGDGTNNDTTNLQACINYAIANKKQINFTGKYKVTPSLQEDNTKLCLYIYRDSSDDSHGNDTGINFNFIRESYIFTESNDECTLIRLNISNINFNNALLKGVSGKTTLLELSKKDKMSATESQWTCYNIFRNLMLLNFKNAITMEGNTYYNTFDKCTIRYGTNGIVLDMTTREKLGFAQDSNVNRNDFSNITIQQTTGKCIAIYYGDTNKFTNISFEDTADGLYIDDPQKHTSDYDIPPLFYTENNMFTNLINENSSGTIIYNNAEGSKFINSSIRYEDSNNNLIIKPQLYIGAGANDNNSIEKVMDIYKSLENTPFPNTQTYSTIIDSPYGHISKYYSDFQYTNDTYKVLSRRNLQFDELLITNLKPGTSLNYESTDKCLVKQIGGIVFLSTKFGMQPDNLSSDISLPINSEIGIGNQLYNYYNIPPIVIPICVLINGVNTLVMCEFYGNKLNLKCPSGGWSSTIYVYLNIHWYRDQLNY